MTEAINNKWEFSLRGNVHFLRGLSGRANNGYDLHFTNPADHYNDTISDDFFFQSWYCNGLEDKNEVHSIGTELLSLFNGVCSIFREDHELITITGLHKDECYVQNSISSTISLRALEPKSSDTHRDLIRGNRKSQLIDLSKTRDDIYDLLKSFSVSTDFRGLSTILEMLEGDSRENSIALNTDQSVKKRFKRTANSFAAIGIEARHGRNRQEPPSNAMTKAEAQVFIRELAQQYLRGVL